VTSDDTRKPASSPRGESVVAAHRVAVDDLAGAVGGKVELAVGEPCRQARVERAERRAEERAADALTEAAVERLEAIGRVARRTERIAQARVAAVNARVEVTAAVAAAARREVAVRDAGAATREELHDAGHRVGAVQDARGPTDDLDAVEIVGRERRQIVGTPGPR
jgi:hypothetical protein